MSKVKFRNGNVMRISDYYLKELVQLSNWVIDNTETSHREHRRAIGLIKRVKRFIYGTDKTNEINRLINEEQQRGVLFKD
ncbi:hypothetical protein [Candidatus Pelagibacter sp. HIMB1506]|jgi:hypothetical protein|uniref:hypothetical protein n=1 Tax=Candidatus Pelagibacter sp. HIMB1506 TaxID=3413337 RepID=UPI003F84B0BA